MKEAGSVQESAYPDNEDMCTGTENSPRNSTGKTGEVR
jgi:hypothetical protein